MGGRKILGHPPARGVGACDKVVCYHPSVPSSRMSEIQVEGGPEWERGVVWGMGHELANASPGLGGPKIDQGSPSAAQYNPKLTPRHPQMTEDRPRWRPRSSESCGYCTGGSAEAFNDALGDVGITASYRICIASGASDMPQKKPSHDLQVPPERPKADPT